MAKKKNKNLTRQGVRDLSSLKGTSRGIRLPDPPGMGANCEHQNMRENRELGFSFCTDCKIVMDEDGCAI